MPRPCLDGLPARVPRTGRRQLSISLSDRTAEDLEVLRSAFSDRSWGDTVRRLIAAEIERRLEVR
jgi:hypothetical protein